jgi:nucleotidyltransferase/DNA polymerase involved in DNA repair
MCCRVPDFLIGLTERANPELAGKPVALLGADELVCAVSPEARQSGVTLRMPARQAQMRCADVRLQPLDMETVQGEQGAFVGKLAECGLPVEAPSWGMAYVDLHAVAITSQTVQPFCADLVLFHKSETHV